MMKTWPAAAALCLACISALLISSEAARADEFATPVCKAVSGTCFQYNPLVPNSATSTVATALIYSGFPRVARVPNPVIEIEGNDIRVSGTFVHCSDCVDLGDPPPVLFQMPLPQLAAGTYTLELRLTPDPNFTPLPAVDTGNGLVIAGVLMTTTFTVVAGSADAEETVVEYHDPTSDHYFMTPLANEIALLDAGQPPFSNWVRTGFSFNAYVNATAPSGTAPICRFFNDSFGDGKSSHFYAAQGLGCGETEEFFQDWQLESPALFNAAIPSTAGSCPAAMVPVYRLYNNGMGGVPNHRFLTDSSERQKMIAQGWIPEGNGVGVGMCSPQ